jgi:DNA replication protein DnaC
MQTLASALARVVKNRPPLDLTNFDPRDPFDPVNVLVERLQRLPPTAPYADELQTLNHHLDLLPDPSSEMDVAEEERTAVLARRRVVHAMLEDLRNRDRLSEGRPDGCWCLGLGGRDPVATYAKLPDCQDLARWPDKDPLAKSWSQCPAVYRVTCSACPEGQAAEARRALAETYARSMGVLNDHARLLDHAEVPTLYLRSTLENYPVTQDTRDAHADLCAWDHRLEHGLPGKRSLWLWGERLGVGKTTLACALLGRWQKRNPTHRALFMNTIELLDAIRSARDTGTSARRLMEDAQARPFAVIDDLGAELDTPWVAEKLFALIDGRHNNMLPTIFTSNLGPTGLSAQLGAAGGDAQLRQAERIVVRLMEMCEIVHISGPDLRDATVRARLGLPAEPGAPAEALTLPF